ncbi:MAG: dethiobiotin synthase [Aminipila sp.]
MSQIHTTLSNALGYEPSNKNNGIFITATGTDVGKTYISAILVKLLRQSGINAGYYKPALSGADFIDGKIIAGDCDYVCKIGNLPVDPNSLVTYTFQTPASPHLASLIDSQAQKGQALALQENPTPFVEKQHLLSGYKELSSSYDFMVVEGCGGIMCPLHVDGGYSSPKTLLLSQLIQELNLNTVIVADAGLGTLNSVFLTMEYAKAKKINVVSIILSRYDKTNFIHQDNKKQIELYTALPVLTCSEGASTIDF